MHIVIELRTRKAYALVATKRTTRKGDTDVDTSGDAGDKMLPG